MEVFINGNSKELKDGITLQQLITEDPNLEDRDGIAIAVNNDVVSRSEWESLRISEGDRIEIIQAVQGG